MKAVVMAGGSGSRLRPLTITRPKPLVPVASNLVLTHILKLLLIHDISEVVITVQHLAEQIQDYFGDGGSMGMTIHYSAEENPLGTAGSVKHAQRFLDDTFLVISGDAITDIDLSAIAAFHQQNDSLATLTLKHVNNPLDYGVVITDSQGRITQFLEKPSWGQVISDTANTGIYVLEPEVLDQLKPNESYDFSQDVLPPLLEQGAALHGYVADGYWCDIGTVQTYMGATSDVLEGRVRHVELGRHIGQGIWVGEDVEIAPDAALYGPIYLGDEVKVRGGAIIYGPTVVRDHTIIDNQARLERTVIWRNCYVGESAEVRGAVIGSQCNIRAKSVTLEGSVIGDNCLVGRGAVIHPNVKIWPGKVVEDGVAVKNSIIWGSQGRRILFGQYGVSGAVNIDLTPEFAARLGAAFGTTLPKGSLVTINRDPHRSPRMLKRAIISGLPSTGVNVWDLGTQPIPVARYFTSHSEAVAGVTVRVSPYDERIVDVRFIDSKGIFLDDGQKRRVEQRFFREDFRRVYLDEIGTISYASGVVERYTRGFMQSIDRNAIRDAQYYIVVDYANSPVATVLPSILNDLNCNVVALNSNVDESRMAIQPYEFQADLDRLGLITSALNAHIGLRFDVAGERISLVDDRGVCLKNSVAAMAMAELALRSLPGSTIAVPVTMPDEFEEIAIRHQGNVIRTKVDTQSLTQVACDNSVLMATDGSGHYIFPQFQATNDGMMAAAKLLEFLAAQHATLSSVIADLPAFDMAHQTVSCPWEAKGIVMRRLHQHFRHDQTDTTDGIKIRFGEGEWALLLPDPDHPLFQLYAEAASPTRTSELMAKTAGLVIDLQSQG